MVFIRFSETICGGAQAAQLYIGASLLHMQYATRTRGQR
jgi:hypothetical protein